MRKKHSFLLTIIPAEDQAQSVIRGRLESISTGDSYTFTTLQELQALINQELLPRSPVARLLEEKKAYPLNPPTYPSIRTEEF
jgi:hypothetical protein